MVCRRGAVSQWVALRPIFEVCERDQGYEGGGWGSILDARGTICNVQVNL